MKDRKREAVNKPTKGGKCKLVTFHKRGGKPVHVWRCSNRRLKAHNRRQCRRGKGKGFKAKQFVRCPR